jgi:glutamate dehydrogenase (NADP+)
MLKKKGMLLAGSRCAVSGSGQVAIATVEKLIEIGAVPVCLSDSSGILYYSQGIREEQLGRIKKMKMANRNTRLSDIVAKSSDAIFFSTVSKSTKSQWESSAYETMNLDYAFPCATEQEVSSNAAENLVSRGLKGLFEGSNFACDNDAIEYLKANKVIYGPSLAANAGGIITNAFEVTQNVQRERWSQSEVDKRLKKVLL